MDDEGINLTEGEGAIIIRGEEQPEIHAPTKHGELYDNIRFTLAFFLYASEREDWIKEFGEFVGSINKKYRKLDADIRRSTFEVIDGEKE